MTFSVLINDGNHPKIIGTVWAANEARAREVAPALIPGAERRSFSVRKAEQCEIPLRLENLE